MTKGAFNDQLHNIDDLLPPAPEKPTVSREATQQPAPDAPVAALLAKLRDDAATALAELAAARDRATELRAAATAAERTYATTRRNIRARGWFTDAQLRALGYPAPRSTRRRPSATPPA